MKTTRLMRAKLETMYMDDEGQAIGAEEGRAEDHVTDEGGIPYGLLVTPKKSLGLPEIYIMEVVTHSTRQQQQQHALWGILRSVPKVLCRKQCYDLPDRVTCTGRRTLSSPDRGHPKENA